MKTISVLSRAAACMTAAVLLVSAAQAKEHEGAAKEHIMMEGGKMMVMKEGKTMPMQKEMTLTDGTKVMPDGTVMMKDGTKKMMKNGESISMEGKMMAPNHKK
ncbi:DUF6799 domain-containing protein [Verrucomicrobiota bacterium sgz303538]